MSTYRCREAFTAYGKGGDLGDIRVIAAGTLVADGDPVLKGRESLFEKVEDHVEKYGRRDRVTKDSEKERDSKVVERATADPGERRSVGRPKVDVEDEKSPRRSPVKAETSASKDKKDGEV